MGPALNSIPIHTFIPGSVVGALSFGPYRSCWYNPDRCCRHCTRNMSMISKSWREFNGGYACDIIIKPGSYAEMPTEWQKLAFWPDSPYIQTGKPILMILNYNDIKV